MSRRQSHPQLHPAERRRRSPLFRHCVSFFKGLLMKLNPNIECLTAFIAVLDDKLHRGIVPSPNETMQLCLLVSFVEWPSHQAGDAAKGDAAIFKLQAARAKPQARQAMARLERRLNGLR